MTCSMRAGSVIVTGPCETRVSRVVARAVIRNRRAAGDHLGDWSRCNPEAGGGHANARLAAHQGGG
jgi:hypothetical protein